MVGEARKASTKTTSPQKTNAAQPARPRAPRGFDDDAEWVPSAKPTGGNKRTYGGRAAKRTNPRPQQRSTDIVAVDRPGGIAFTPLIARHGTQFLQSPNLQSSPLRGKRQRPVIAKAEQIKKLKAEMPCQKDRVFLGLLDAYVNLIEATDQEQDRNPRGARSLMSTCLKKIPAYIVLEEYFAGLDKEEADEDGINTLDRDVSDEIYTHLEKTYESGTGLGWAALREIVRAHGTSLLCDAFADGIFCNMFTDDTLGIQALQTIVQLCMRLSAWDEAEQFLWTYLDNLKTIPTPIHLCADLFSPGNKTRITTSVYMRLANELVEKTGRHGFLYDLLEHMISQELLPLEWLATECMGPIWKRLVLTLSEGDNRAFGHAFRFLQTTVFAGVGLPDDSVFQDGEVDVVLKQIKPSVRQELRGALDTTFSSLFTILASIALVSHNQAESTDKDKSTVHRLTWILDYMAIGLLRRQDIRSDLELLDTTTENMQTFAQRALWAMAASSLVHLGGCTTGPHMISLDTTTFFKAFSWVTHQYSCYEIDISALLATLPLFISSTASCSGKASQDDGLLQLQGLVNGLLSLPGIRLPHKLWSLKRLALEASMEFAVSTNDREHFSYARQVERLLSSQGRVVLHSSPLRNDSHPAAGGGFRWEEGIGEWVTCTPFVKQTGKKVKRGAVRPLALLPSPEPSEIEETDEETGTDKDEGMLVLDEEEEEDADIWAENAYPQSSPVKQRPRSSLGKRIRTSSPRVVIPVKRTRVLTPDSASSSRHTSPLVVIPTKSTSARSSLDNSFTSFSSETSDPGPRRSHRTRTSTNVSKAPRPTRSRSSLDNNLRNITPKSYLFDGDDVEDEDTDELGKTPAGMKSKWKNSTAAAVVGRSKIEEKTRRRSGRRTENRIPLTVVQNLRQGDEESEDELSFQ